MTESLTNFENQENSDFNNSEKPRLLKVLCILSWTGSGMQIFSSTFYSTFISESVKEDFFALLPDD